MTGSNGNKPYPMGAIRRRAWRGFVNVSMPSQRLEGRRFSFTAKLKVQSIPRLTAGMLFA
jgi:hypothetical protein